MKIKYQNLAVEHLNIILSGLLKCTTSEQSYSVAYTSVCAKMSMGCRSTVFVIFSSPNVRWRPAPALWIIWCTIEPEQKNNHNLQNPCLPWCLSWGFPRNEKENMRSIDLKENLTLAKVWRHKKQHYMYHFTAFVSSIMAPTLMFLKIWKPD